MGQFPNYVCVCVCVQNQVCNEILSVLFVDLAYQNGKHQFNRNHFLYSFRLNADFPSPTRPEMSR